MNWRFDRLARTKNLEFAAVVAAAAAIAGVVIGQGAERFAASAPPSLTALFGATDAGAQAASRRAPIFNAVDYATTASLKGQTVVIAPCAGHPVER